MSFMTLDGKFRRQGRIQIFLFFNKIFYFIFKYVSLSSIKKKKKPSGLYYYGKQFQFQARIEKKTKLEPLNNFQS